MFFKTKRILIYNILKYLPNSEKQDLKDQINSRINQLDN